MSRGVPYSANPLLRIRLPAYRSRLLLLLIGLAFIALVGRTAYLQLFTHGFLQKQGESRYGRTIELPVVYGGEAGPHMADVMAHTGLDAQQLSEIHSAPLYPVYALGSHPGYCYLGGMDHRIATPRRKTPVLKIPGGAVSIGGFQTGVSASDGPSGWNTIGSTSMSFFDVTKQPPTLLQPGDSIRFRIERVVG